MDSGGVVGSESRTTGRRGLAGTLAAPGHPAASGGRIVHLPCLPDGL